MKGEKMEEKNLAKEMLEKIEKYRQDSSGAGGDGTVSDVGIKNKTVNPEDGEKEVFFEGDSGQLRFGGPNDIVSGGADRYADGKTSEEDTDVPEGIYFAPGEPEENKAAAYGEVNTSYGQKIQTEGYDAGNYSESAVREKWLADGVQLTFLDMGDQADEDYSVTGYPVGKISDEYENQLKQDLRDSAEELPESKAAEEPETEEIPEGIPDDGDYSNDVWDESDRVLWNAKKRYMDYCGQLTVPPLKMTKEAPEGLKKEKGKIRESSGYRCEMSERLPAFTDGINGGKNSEGYIKREKEYCEQRESERSGKLLSKLRSGFARTVVTFVVMCSVLLLENISFFVGKFTETQISGTGLYFLLGAQLLLLIAGVAMVADSIADALKCFAKGVYIPELLTFGIVTFSIIYHIVLLVRGNIPSGAALFGTSAAVSVFLTSLYRYNMLKREYTVFSVASSYGKYLTEVKMLGMRNSPEGKAFEGYISPDASLYRMNRVSRIDGVYDTRAVRDECGGLIRKLVICIVCATVVTGVVFGLLRQDVVNGVLSAMTFASFSAPLCVFVAMYRPRVKAAEISAKAGAAPVDFDDEGDDFDESIIMIDDGELFPPEKLVTEGFEMQRSEQLEKHLSRVFALFSTIGGSLSSLFKNMEGGLEKIQDIVVTDIDDHGISAKVDGKFVRAGSEEYLAQFGIRVKRYDKLISRNTRVMYIADEEVFFARAILTFRPDEEVVRKISELRNTETVFSLKTCNPCIDKELLFFSTGLEPELIRLIKYSPSDNLGPLDTDREGMLVSKNGAAGLLTAMLEYKRQKRLITGGARLAGIACAVGAIAALVTVAFGIDFGFVSLMSAALHGILSLTAYALCGRRAINTKSKMKKD